MALMPLSEILAVCGSSTSGISRYLTEISSKDKPWDVKKNFASIVAVLYRGTEMERYAERIQECAQRLGFEVVFDDDGKPKLKLHSVKFCRVRHCPICIWRRSLMWRAKFFQLIPTLVRDYPDARFVFLTLTVKNCQLTDLHGTIQQINDAWTRLTQSVDWPAEGYVKSIEVTRERDGSERFTGYVHPHIHAILMVKPGYFKRGYVSHARWTELWQRSLRIEYVPVVHVQAVKANPKKQPDSVNQTQSGVVDGLTETLKYSVKPDDLIGLEPGVSINEKFEENQRFIVELTRQMHKVKAVSVGGIFRKYIKGTDLTEPTNEQMIHLNDQGEVEEEGVGKLYFAWNGIWKKYELTEEV